MTKTRLYIIILLLVASSLFLFATKGTGNSYVTSAYFLSDDTIPRTRFGTTKTVPETHDDLTSNPADLRNPENITTETEYDEIDGTYRLGNKMGESFLGVPVLMTPEEYAQWSMTKSLQEYYRSKNQEEFTNEGQEKFDFSDMKFDLGPAEKIFGPGGVQIKTQGSAELKMGFSMQNIDNPTLPERSRNTFSFDFDEKINLSIKGSVGDKMNLNMNYNTEATFDFDTKKIKLTYEGDEDDIIQLLEGGNVSFPTNSSLIKGATSLFGIRADLKFGKLKLQTVISQKNSTSTSVSSKGGSQVTPFELDIADYDENRHFFLAHYFHDNYDKGMEQLPTIISGVTINRIELWVTNKTSNYSSPRNIVAFTDLGEPKDISNSKWTATTGEAIPYNNANTLYSEMVNSYAELRNIDQVNAVFEGMSDFEGGADYEKISNARLLSSSEYTLNSSLGYISLKTALKSDEVLGIAFEYTYGGKTYQVGELSGDQHESSTTLFVKLLKPNSNSPSNGCWDLMMKNVYSLGATNISSTSFKMDIYFTSDSLGTNITYLPESNLKNIPLLRLLGLDRLDASCKKANPNGSFDFISGYTINVSNGRIFFPVVEPFGSYLKGKIGDEVIAEKYIYQELYDSTKTVAKQIAEKDKYYLAGEFSGSLANVIQTGSYNIPRGSVTVTAGGVTLMENTDYTVDYSMGEVTIINQSIIDAGTAVNVSLESNTDYNMQRKTMLGMNWEYDFSDKFQIGGTIMHLSEKPLTSKVSMGSEPLKNTLWGLNLAWKTESQWLTNMLDKIPLIDCTQPSSINLTADFAQLIAGTSDELQSSASYIDDFESTENGIDISSPSAWTLSAIPSSMPYATLTNDLRTGMNRALVNWFTIDPLFTRRSSSLTPSHIKSDLDQLSNHYVREIYERELYPNKESTYGESSTLSIFNVAFYPDERGPYNLDTDLNSEGKLNNPENRWGGIMRQLSTTDFESSNVEYIEFWLLDPFIYDSLSNGGGELYFNLGEVSEDVLKDGKKFYENGLPTNQTASSYSETVWGRIPNATSLVYAFDNSGSSRSAQDVGLNGLSTQDEQNFSTYADYLTTVRGIVSSSAYESFLNDPAADNYHYFRGSDYDTEERSILDRYKHYNNTEGNSIASGDSGESYDTSSKTTPDVEDANQDYTLDEYEKYYQYRVSLRPENFKVGSNYIADKRTVISKLRNGNTESVNWYKFRIPVDEWDEKVGSINDFTSIRFIRMYLTGFSKPVVLRFASLQLIRDEWRTYEQPIYSSSNSAPTMSGSMIISSINIEENGDREPVNYVLPPGISRVIDPSQPQLRQDNEQALSIQVSNLGSNEARAVYKKQTLDIRQYERIQMFIHAEALEENTTLLESGELSVFIRLGADYKNNYYEYEMPLSLTPPGNYDGNTSTGCIAVWPEENMLNINLSKLTAVKVNRNTKRNNKIDGVTNTTIYYEYDADNEKNKISVIGNPSLGTIKTVMVGVRNNSRNSKSGIVWINELRLIGFNNKSGWAAQGAMNMQLSDLGSLNLTGHVETAGFGGLEEGLSRRRIDDYYQYSITTNFNLGRFFPKKANVSIPLYYSYTKEWTTPLYSPYDTDLLLEDVLDSYSGHQRDSIQNISEEMNTSKNFSLSNVKVNIASKKPMPYDPANFSFSYSRSVVDKSGSTIDYQTQLNWKASINYTYAPSLKAWEPFKNIESKSKWLQIFKDFGINFIPQSFALNTTMSRSYYELQTRDLDNSFGGSAIPVSFSQEFFWDREMSIRWDLTKNLKMNLKTATHAEIEEPYLPVNKSLYPDEYAIWKDSVKQSILNMGRPLDYQQSFSASYQAPINKIPLFEWVQADASYSGSYSWQRGSSSSGGVSYGNTIGNKRSVSINGKFNMETLYNKVPFLQETNKRFAASKSTTSKNTRSAPNSKAKKPQTKNTPEKQAKAYSSEIQLNMDSAISVKHNQKSKRPIVSARTKAGKTYKLKYKVVDENTILVKNKDSISVKVSVIPGPKLEDQKWYKIAQYPARFLMMIRNASITYTNSYSMSLPGFLPNVGDMLGQRSGNGMYAPGIDFAFGLTGDSYLQRAYDNGWLLSNDSISMQANTSAAQDLQLKMTLEPFPDFKIDLNASWTKSNSRSVQFMYLGMPETQTGTFSMTTITIGSAFEGGNADNEYHSKAFNRFVDNLDVIQQRRQAKYEGSTYPEGTALAGQPYDPANGTVDRYSADVMIPAFLSAYTGRDAGGTFLDLFPSFLSMLPNWSIKYSGLSKLEFFQQYFKSFNINHAYKSIYSVGSYNTFSSYMEYMNGYGFVESVSTGNLIPSSMYDVSTVSINESFSPLIGVDMTFNNGITAKLEYKKTRVLNLSMTAIQVVETNSEDFVIGLGYKLTNLKLFGKSTGKKAISNDLNLRADFTLKNQNALCRSIDELTTQATSGNKAINFSFSADYTYSKMLTISAYFDRQKTIPLISASAYPTTTTDFGISLKFSLTR